MTDELTTLSQKDPEIAKFLSSWKTKYENRTFDFKFEFDQSEFCEAINEMSKHIAHRASTGNIRLIIDEKGLSTIYVNCTQPPS